jgi:predicted DsbA family dithiol-disulfide isomerase
LRLYQEQHPDAEKPAVRWLPFQLNPDIPPEGMSRKAYVEGKFGPGGNAKYSRVAGVGKGVGIDFAFDKIQVQPNTVDAHRLLHYATTHGREDAVAEALFTAYFVDGANLTDMDTLADIGASGGLDREAVAAYIRSDADRELVIDADLEARNSGVQGVPFFIFNRKVGVSGAQETETLLQAMLQSMDEEAKA